MEPPNEEMRKIPDALADIGRYRALGQMLAGFVHQLRTPLHVIESGVEDLKQLRAFPAEANARLELIQRSVERLQSCVQSLLEFARNGEEPFAEASLNGVLERVCDYLLDECPRRRVRLEKQLEPRLPLIALKERCLEEALLNLAVNALEAMPDGGLLTLHTCRSSDGRELILEVSDQGKGMDPDILLKEGTPFVTTKKGGMGLGLFFTRKILDQHHAQLAFHSEPDQGTTAVVTFPL